MPKSRDNAQIAATNFDDLLVQLNFILQRFNDRLDKLEGLRSSFETEGGGAFKGRVTITDDGTELHSLS